MLRHFHDLVALVDGHAQGKAVGLKGREEVLHRVHEDAGEGRGTPHFVIILGIPDQAVTGYGGPALHQTAQHFALVDLPDGHGLDGSGGYRRGGFAGNRRC